MCDVMRLCGVVFVYGHKGARATICSTAAVTLSINSTGLNAL